jgi:hypothetical protein
MLTVQEKLIYGNTNEIILLTVLFYTIECNIKTKIFYVI